MKELRVQHQGKPYRILFAFDPRRAAYLILGGDKTGEANWYRVNVIVRNLRAHLREILAAQRHCMYREALEEHLKTCESIGATREKLATRH